MSHQSIIAHWQKEAEAARERAFRFFRWLKTLDRGKVDRLAKETHTEVFKAVDCLQCTNCCRTLKPEFRPRDLKAVSAYLGLGVKDLTEKYLQRTPQGNWETNALPCPFLATETGYCKIYPVRPADCSGYPHTDHPPFSGRSWAHSENVVTCPAVFTILERMQARMGYRDEGA